MKQVRLYFVMVLAVVTMQFQGALAQTCTEAAKCDITVWHIFSDHRGDWLIDAANRFNELYPQYNITPENPGDYTAILDGYTLAQEQGNPPEIALIFDAGLQFAADSGFFKYADDIVAGREEILGQAVNFDDIVKPAASYYTVDGRWASVAWNTSTSISYANMDILKSVGIEAIPTTWQELMSACEALQAKVDAGELEGCASWPLDDWFTEQWLAQMNQYLVNNENGRADRATELMLTTPEFLAVTDFYRTMYEKGYYVYTGTRRDWDGPSNLFNTGKIAFSLSSSADARNKVEAAKAGDFELATGKLIRNDDYEYNGNIIGGATMWITAGLEPEVEDGAMAFLLFINNTENSASFHTASGYIPIRNSSVELLQNLQPGNNIFWDVDNKTRADIESSNWFETNPNFLTASIQLSESTVNNASAGAKFGTFRETRDLIETGVEDIMLNGKDAKEVMSAVEEQANKLLEEYNFLYTETQ
jgi:sn-glycerol 3-phosphate transport system substrate-binding protein